MDEREYMYTTSLVLFVGVLCVLSKSLSMGFCQIRQICWVLMFGSLLSGGFYAGSSSLPWASIIGWTGGQVPPLFEVGGRNVLSPHFWGQQIFIVCKFTIFLLLILREMDISLRG